MFPQVCRVGGGRSGLLCGQVTWWAPALPWGTSATPLVAGWGAGTVRWLLLSCWEREAPCPGGVWCPGGAPLPIPRLPCPEHCPSLSPTVSPAPPEAETMASKPEKRVASSVFITLVPPRRDEAVVEEVRRAACEARPGRPWESPAPTKALGAGSVGKLRSWMPPGRAAAPGPAVPPQLSNGGKRVRAMDEGDGLRGSTEMGSKEQALRSFVEHLLCSRPTLESTCLGVNPDSSTCWLCDFGKPFNLSVPQFLNL